MRLGKDKRGWPATCIIRTNECLSIEALHRALSPKPTPPVSDSAAGMDRSPIACAREKPYNLSHRRSQPSRRTAESVASVDLDRWLRCHDRRVREATVS
jgi:hypothetical protein